MLFKKKIYVLEGYTWELKNQYPLLLEDMLFPNYKKAYKEIMDIAEDIKENSKEMGWDVDIKWKEEFKTLEVNYSNGTVDNYIILEREIVKR